jgi:hypothetical protein
MIRRWSLIGYFLILYCPSSRCHYGGTSPACQCKLTAPFFFLCSAETGGLRGAVQPLHRQPVAGADGAAQPGVGEPAGAVRALLQLPAARGAQPAAAAAARRGPGGPAAAGGPQRRERPLLNVKDAIESYRNLPLNFKVAF